MVHVLKGFARFTKISKLFWEFRHFRFDIGIKLLFEIIKSGQVRKSGLARNPCTIGPVNVVAPESKHLQAFLMTMTKFNTRVGNCLRNVGRRIAGSRRNVVRIGDGSTGTLTVTTGSRNVVIGSTNEGISAMVALIDESSGLRSRQAERIFEKISPSSSVSSHDDRGDKI